MAPAPAGVASEGGLQAQTAYVIGTLQRALSQVLTAFPEVKRSTDLRRRLGLDAALAWQVFSLARAEEPLGAGRFIPKARAMERFMHAAAKAGAPEALCEALEFAYQAFGSFVLAHAGDRETFSAMLSALQPEDRSDWTKLRRSAFRANCGVWGVSVECSVNCAIFHQRATGEFDVLSIRGRVGISSLRAGVAIATSASSRAWGGSKPPPENADAADSSAPVITSGGGLIVEACSQPLPRIETRIGNDGAARDYLELEGLGRRSKATAWWRSFSADFAGSRQPPHGCSCPCAEPTELQIVDLMVPQGWCVPSRVRTRIMGPDVRFTPSSLTGSLPFEGGPVHLGQRLESLYTPAAPAHSGLVMEELKQRGWLGTTFEIFRAFVKFPVLHSTTHLYVE